MYTEKVMDVHILTDGVSDGYYDEGRIIACGTKDEIIRYKKQLIRNGWTCELMILHKVYIGWDNVIRVENRRLYVYNGILYTKHDMDKLKEKKRREMYKQFI